MGQFYRPMGADVADDRPLQQVVKLEGHDKFDRSSYSH
jgi:hypothetical protein